MALNELLGYGGKDHNEDPQGDIVRCVEDVLKRNDIWESRVEELKAVSQTLSLCSVICRGRGVA